ncbi:MAG: hypothetical protein AAF702_03135 [Chloroflexota bacterium]
MYSKYDSHSSNNMNGNGNPSNLKMILAILITSAVFATILVTIFGQLTTNLSPTQETLPAVQETLPVVSGSSVVSSLGEITTTAGISVSVISAQQTKIANDAGSNTAEVVASATPIAQNVEVKEPQIEEENRPTETSVPIEPVYDYTVAYTDRPGCIAITEISQQLITQKLQLSIGNVKFDTVVDLFTALASGDVDLTFCYSDPADRTHMLEHLGEIRQVGIRHYESDMYKLQIWANGNSKAQIRRDQPCFLHFLEKVDFTDVFTEEQSPDEFINGNDVIIQGWFDCPFS